MTDRERDRNWPRDGPIRWDRLAARLGYQAVAVASMAAHLVLGVVLVATIGTRLIDWLLAIAWGGLALFAVWSWWFHRRRIVLAPVTLAALALVAGRLPPT